MELQVWTDLDLAWDTADYQYDEMVLPVAKVWTPELHVTNGSVRQSFSQVTLPGLTVPVTHPCAALTPT